MARTSVATDGFDRASLGTDWAQLNTYNGTIRTQDSLYVNSTGNGQPGITAAARWVGAGTFTDDQYASLEIRVLSYQSTSYNVGVICRASGDQDSNRDWYGASVCLDASSSYTTKLLKVVNGTVTELHSASVAWSVGDKIELEVEGTTLRLCKNGTALGGSFTQTDSSLSTGLPGVAIALGSETTFYADNWEGGNLSSAPTIIPHARFMLTGIG